MYSIDPFLGFLLAVMHGTVRITFQQYIKTCSNINHLLEFSSKEVLSIVFQLPIYCLPKVGRQYIYLKQSLWIIKILDFLVEFTAELQNSNCNYKV